jgi:hypothetical protein
VRLMPDADDRSIIDTFKEDYPDYHISKAGPNRSDLGQTNV